MEACGASALCAAALETAAGELDVEVCVGVIRRFLVGFRGESGSQQTGNRQEWNVIRAESIGRELNGDEIDRYLLGFVGFAQCFHRSIAALRSARLSEWW